MKRIISLLLTIALLCTTWGCNTKQSTVNSDGGEYITRASWVENVGKYFGMTDYLSDTPYFSDIPTTSPIFSYVQSCYEWGAISTDSETFNPDDVATLGFAVCSAVMVIKGGETGLTNEDLLAYALDNNLISEEEIEKSLNTGLTSQRANELVVAAETIYLTENIEIINELTLVEGVENYSNETENIIYLSENEYVMDASIANEIEINDVIAVPGNDGINEEVAVKIVSMEENSDGTYTVTTVQPEFSEVFSEINIQGTRYVDYEEFIPVEGVTVYPLEPDVTTTSFKGIQSKPYSNIRCESIVDADGNPISIVNEPINKANWGIEVTLNSKGEIKQSADASFVNDYVELAVGSDGKVSVTDKLNLIGEDLKVEYEVPDKSDADLTTFSKELGIDVNEMIDNHALTLVQDYKAGIISPKNLKAKIAKGEKRAKFSKKGEFESGWEITGKVEVKNFAITPDIQFGKILGKTNYTDFKKATVRVTGEVVSSLNVKGELSGEKKIGDLPVQIVPGMTFNVQFFVYFDANGELTVSTKVIVDDKIELKKGASPKITNNTTLENSVEAKLELEAGIAVGVAIYILGFDVVSLRAKVGLGADISGGYVRSDKVEETENGLIYTETYKITGDGGIYFPIIKIEVNQTKGNILGKLGLKITKDITTKDSIKEGGFGKYISFYGDSGYEHIVLQRIITININEEEETEEIRGDYLLLTDVAIEMNVGTCYELAIENLPPGYEETDIVWSSSDSSVATVADGLVSANAAGSATITAKTSDGEYSVLCNVIVAE